MRHIRSIFEISARMLLLLAVSAGYAQATANVTALAQRGVTSYLSQLANLHCSESVVQEKLAMNGSVQASEHSKYDYLTMIDGDSDALQLNESRLEETGARHKALPMLVTNGFSTLLLIFHPYYAGSFEFTVAGETTEGARQLVEMHFTHIVGRRSPVALALRGREFPLGLEGTALVDKATGDVVRIHAALEKDMSDIGLRTFQVDVDYSPVNLGAPVGRLMLPDSAVVEVVTPRQRWKNTHLFRDYKLFATEAEQSAEVKIRPDKKTEEPQVSTSDLNRPAKEKH
jgi:hypothetical protein